MAASFDSHDLSFQDLTFDSSLDGVIVQLNATPNPEMNTQNSDVNFPNQPSPESIGASNVSVVESAKDYSLNIDKALKKKIAVCHQVKAEYECTGGGITGRMDTATFELFRLACSKLYREFPPDEGFCKVMDIDDKHGKAVVQHTFKVCRKVDGNVVSYTINLYPTNNRLLINGKDVDKFMDAHLPLLHQMMINAMSENGFLGIDAMNRILADQMQAVLNQRRGEDGVPEGLSEDCDRLAVVTPDPCSMTGSDSGTGSISRERGDSNCC